jgi:hypothetical protein
VAGIGVWTLIASDLLAKITEDVGQIRVRQKKADKLYV